MVKRTITSDAPTARQAITLPTTPETAKVDVDQKTAGSDVDSQIRDEWHTAMEAALRINLGEHAIIQVEQSIDYQMPSADFIIRTEKEIPARLFNYFKIPQSERTMYADMVQAGM